MTKSDLDEWLKFTASGDAQLVCAWRKRAWRAMRPVVEKVAADMSQWTVSKALKALDAAAYEARIKPTGKRWRNEYAEIKRILETERALWRVPTEDDRGVCSVAFDLVEQEQYAEALALLAQAPHILERPCTACSAPAGWACVEICADDYPGEDTPQTAALKASGTKTYSRRSLIVPHEARLA